MSNSSEDVPYRPMMVEKKYTKGWLKKQREAQERILHQHQIAIQAWEIFFYMKEDEEDESVEESPKIKNRY